MKEEEEWSKKDVEKFTIEMIDEQVKELSMKGLLLVRKKVNKEIALRDGLRKNKKH